MGTTGGATPPPECLGGNHPSMRKTSCQRSSIMPTTTAVPSKPGTVTNTWRVVCSQLEPDMMSTSAQSSEVAQEAAHARHVVTRRAARPNPPKPTPTRFACPGKTGTDRLVVRTTQFYLSDTAETVYRKTKIPVASSDVWWRHRHTSASAWRRRAPKRLPSADLSTKSHTRSKALTPEIP